MFCKKCGAKIKRRNKVLFQMWRSGKSDCFKGDEEQPEDVLRHKIQDFGKTPEGEASGDKKNPSKMGVWGGCCCCGSSSGCGNRKYWRNR